MKSIMKKKSIATLFIAFALTFAFGLCMLATSHKFAYAATTYFDNVSVTLDENIKVNIVIKAPDGYTQAKIDFSIGEGQETVTADIQNGTATLSTGLVTPQYMNEEVTVTVAYTSGNEKLDVTGTISAKRYLDEIRSGSAEKYGELPFAYEDLKLLADDLLDYGASAQNYVDYNTDNLANGGKVGGNEFKATGSDYKKTGGFTWYVGAEFDYSVKPVFVFKTPDNYTLSEDVTAEISCNEKNATAEIVPENGTYRVTYDDFDLLDAEQPYTLTVKENGKETASVTYSLKTLAQTAKDEKLSALLKDTFVYATSAVAYSNDKKVKITKLEYKGESLKVRIDSTIEFDGKVTATYDNGKSEEITVQNPVLKKVLPEEEVTIGKKYTVKVEAASDSTVYTEIPVTVEKFLQAENATIAGGEKKTETEYVYKNNSYVAIGDVTFAGGFVSAVQGGQDAYVEFEVNAATDTKVDITLRCANSNIRRDGDYYYMEPLKINTIADITVDGTPVTIGDDVVLAGTGNENRPKDFSPLYNIYSSFTFADVNLKAGKNTIRLTFKLSSIGEKNYWSESPSTMNIDWISVTSK
ncbi:MAG TPA: hypothetical protein DDY77_01670 [Clostridiales bacterium]|nr:hypothetical protein [Clostridiales bacterium]